MLSNRSKCNEVRTSLSGAAAVDLNNTSAERPTMSNSKHVRETHQGISGGIIASSNSSAGNFGTLQQPQQNHQPTLLDEMMTHNL